MNSFQSACRIGIASVLLIASAWIRAQPGGDLRPEAPEIVHVTVDTASGKAIIKWEPGADTDIERYIVYYHIPGIEGALAYDIVPGTEREYTYDEDLNPSENSLRLTVAAVDSNGSPGLLPDTAHRTIFVSTFHDSCSQSIELEWNSYIGWGNKLVKYDIYCSIDGTGYSIIGTNSPGKTTFTHHDIENNRQYCYFVEAIHPEPGTGSFSNISCRYISHPLHPAWINAESASASGSDSVELKFAMDPAAEVTSYQLFKASGIGKPFVADAIIRNVGETLTWVDPVLTTEKQYQYKLFSLDVCDNPFPLSASNISGNIVLSGSSKGLVASLSWSPYIEYEAGVEFYRIYRDINRDGPQYLHFVNHPDTVFEDDLSDFSSEQIEDEICYYVEAVERSGWTLGERGSSWSNRACVTVVPEITMANAFTPNDDGKNDCIKPVLTFHPPDYLFMVFDRWGSRIFQATEYTSYEDDPCGYAWDGRVNGGKKVPEGVYVYYIKLTTSSGIEVEKKGEITVFYP